MPTSRIVLLALVVIIVVVIAVKVVPSVVAKSQLNDKLTECARLRALLESQRRQGGDAVAAAQTAAALERCVQEANALGGHLSSADATLVDCDSAYTQMVEEFSHYKSTSYSDPVKRNNTRTTILRLGEDQARCYQTAIASATSSQAVNLIRESILRSLEAAIDRRSCYLYDMEGCGRFGLNEDDATAKGAQEKQRVIDPLIVAYQASLARLTALGAGAVDVPSSYGVRSYASVRLRECVAMADGAQREFRAYQGVDYGDPVQRNNKRQNVLRLGAQAAACFQALVDEYRHELIPLRMMRPAIAQAFTDSEARARCFLDDQRGCGRFALNEDHGNDKFNQENDQVTQPTSRALATCDLEIQEAIRETPVDYGRVLSSGALGALQLPAITFNLGG